MSVVAASVPNTPANAGRQFSLFAALLSYLFPGLGQIYQGRIAKGLLFFVCIYALFFYGMYLGSGTRTIDGKTYRVSTNVYLPDTAHLAGGNPFNLPNTTLANLYNRPQFAAQFWVGVAAWPAIWQYLNYDRTKPGDSLFGRFQRQPPDEDLNVIQNTSEKLIELGWVYTVIAGVLNIMVIYDAFAGPAFLAAGTGSRKEGRA